MTKRRRLPGEVAASPEGSLVARHAEGRWSTIVPTVTRDQLATAVVVLEYLDQVGLGPRADHAEVARALDEVAIACSPHRDLAVNPAKMLAIALADTNPIAWGGSSLAARAARRVSETIRRASGRTAIAGDAEHLLPLIQAVRPRDVFDDPFAEGQSEARPMLILFDDGADDAVVRDDRDRLRTAARRPGRDPDDRGRDRGRAIRFPRAPGEVCRGVPPDRPRRGLSLRSR